MASHMGSVALMAKDNLGSSAVADMKQLRRRTKGIAARLGIAFFTVVAVAAPAIAASDIEIRLGVVSDLLMHLPLFVAEDKKIFADEKTVVLAKTKFGKFRTSASLINQEVDIILQTTEAYFELADLYGATSYKIIGGLTATAGSVVIARDPIPNAGFSWKQLRQKRFLGRDKNLAPMYFLRSVLLTNGVDPANVEFNTTAPVPARARIWRKERTYDYALFFEPDASTIIREGNGYFAAMLGPAVGKIDSTVFIIRAAFLKSKKNRDLVQRFMNAMQKSLNATANESVDELAAIASRHSKDSTLGSSRGVPGQDLVSAIKRYRAIGLWKKDLRLAPRAMTDIQRLIVDGGGTRTKKHRCYNDIIDSRFSRAALAKYPPAGPIEKLPNGIVPSECG